MKFITNLKNAFLSIPRKGQHNVVKILCLGVGLAVGIILISKVCFEQDYDTFFPKAERTYRIYEKIIRNGEYKEFPHTSGATAPGIKRYAPQVEMATRYTDWADDCSIQTQDQKKLKANVGFADSCFFDVLQRPILQGDVKQALSRPFYCMINRRLAEAIGDDVMGKELMLNDIDSTKVIVGGVYEDIPRNSTMYDVNVILSLSTLKKLWNGNADGTENWKGNDRYESFIRLKENTKITDIIPSVEKMRKEHFELDEMKKAGVDLNYTYIPIAKVHNSDSSVKKMSWILSLLAFVLIFSAVMNYLLIVIGNMVGRSKEMAVRKCYGGERKNILSILFSEALVHLLLSLLFAALLIFLCRGTIEALLDAPANVLLLNSGSWILLLVCTIVLLIVGILPGYMYANIPVATVFRGSKETRRRWKLILLAVQFVAASFLVSLLFVINNQYSMMINDNPGYQCDNLALVKLNSASDEEGNKIVNELKRLPEVESVTSADNLLFNSQSGDNVFLPNDDKEYFNIADLYNVSDDYLATMGIKIVQGRNFTEQTDSMKEVMVSKNFVERMKVLAHWDDNAIGRRVHITSYEGFYEICGVYDSIRIGSINDPDPRPSAMFYTKEIRSNVIIKLHQFTPEAMAKLRNTLKQIYPEKDLEVLSCKTLVTDSYKPEYKFRESVLIGGLVTLFIALIGLIGYTNDEVIRRQKEIAIRKVNGAQVRDIMHLFLKDILRIAIPTLIIGCIGALAVAHKWLEQFSEKTPLSFWLFFGSAMLVLIIILAAVIVNCRKVANSNPVEFIKGE
jgi:putative ABC transport system permease protein